MDKIEKQELINSVAKTLLANIPYVGAILNEVIYDFRGRIKQERINNFVILLSEYFGNNPVKDEGILTSEDFGDLFEAVLKRVALTKSQQKHARFRDILINYINHPYLDSDDTDVFLELISYLNDTAIIILKHHKIFDADFDFKRIYYNKLNAEIIQLQNFSLGNSVSGTVSQRTLLDKVQELKELDDEFKELEKTKEAKFYNISEESFLYYKQILFARGLLSDKGVGAIGIKPFQNMGITEFGIKFINFIVSTTV